MLDLHPSQQRNEHLGPGMGIPGFRFLDFRVNSGFQRSVCFYCGLRKGDFCNPFSNSLGNSLWKAATVGFDLPQCFLRAKDERLEAGLVSLKDFKPSGLKGFRCIIP